MSQQTKDGKNFLKQGGILAGASILVRFIGMIYRIPMANIIGEEGNGIYAVAFELYDMILIISSYSLPLALSKIISAFTVKRQYKNIGKTFRLASIFAFVSGGVFGTLLFFGAGFIEEAFYNKYSGIHIPLKILAPTIFIVAFLGVFRGFFQGKKTMIPTAVSQVLEQIVNAAASIICAYTFIRIYKDTEYESAWGAAGGTAGTCLGALLALLFLFFLYRLYRPLKRKQERRDHSQTIASGGQILLVLLATIFPIILSQTVYQISGIIDMKIFQDIMGLKGYADSVIRSLTGIYSSKYRLLCGVPIAISTAIATSMIPSIVTSYTNRDIRSVKDKTAESVKFNMMIAFPCAVGLAVLGQPIIRMLFPGSDYVLGGRFMIAGSASIIFFSLSNVTGGALQSINKMRLPVIHSAISLLLHITILLALLKFTDLGGYALIIANVTFPIPVFLMNFAALKKYIGYRQELLKTIFVAFSASLWMALAIAAVYWPLGRITSSAVLLSLSSLAVAVFAYFAVYIKLRGVSKTELFDFPMGRRMYLLAHKMHLMK